MTTGLLNDKEISRLANEGMITPFVPELVRWVDAFKVISYGVSSYGYDLRLSAKEFKVFRHIPGTIVNPKAFNPANLESIELKTDEYGDYFIIPANSYGLGVALERLDVPENITVICIGKSTYARSGIIANVTPAEAGWHGHLTLEFSNASSTDCRIYANEGIVQLLFLRGAECAVSYNDRAGKYQGQSEQIVLAKA